MKHMTKATDCRDNLTMRIPASWLVLILLDLFLVAAAWAQDTAQTPEQPAAPPRVTVLKSSSSEELNSDAVHFEAIDVFVDSGTTPLAAYQCELKSRSEGVEIVGIEGGEHAAFSNPPYYDPRAMNHNRVILAAYHIGDDLPSGRSRVARIHVQLQGSGDREYETLLTASASSDGDRIPAEITIARAETRP